MQTQEVAQLALELLDEPASLTTGRMASLTARLRSSSISVLEGSISAREGPYAKEINEIY